VENSQERDSTVKNVLITGAARGLGLAIAKRLAGDGYNVIGVGRSLTEEYQSLIDQSSNGHVSFEIYDLNELEGIPDLVSSVSRNVGPLYGLINNAAIGLDGLLATMHASEISRILRVNLEAPILLAKFACRSMLERKEGRIINISSIIATTGFNGLSVYGATKAGLGGFTRSLARELGRANITVNCIAPGFMATEMTAGLEGDKLESIRRRAPLGLAEPKDAAGAVAYLLSEDAKRLTGTTVTVDGGSTA
jgi:3-oxoacyl-[acyl-carrier protein] reductase